jgi:monoamine oxidase
MTQPFSRRAFLQLAGAIGGSAAVYRTAYGLGLVPAGASPGRPDLAPLPKAGRKSVLILGAGIGGLTAAYELSRKGYDVQVLEASHRAGGRNLTLRSGDLVDEVGRPQVCKFDRDPDLYFNAGPARIPGHHTALLGYCRELGIELAPFINENRNAWVQDDSTNGGKPLRNREYATDTRGFVAELVSKSMHPAQFDARLSPDDVARLREFFRQFGELDADFRYKGSSRAGLASHDYTSPAELKVPAGFKDLLHSPIMSTLNFGDSYDQSAMLMEPVGGMDRIVAGFMAKVGRLVRTHAVVEKIMLKDRGVEVVYRHNGRTQVATADYCLNSIPSHLLAGLEHNFPADYATGLAAIPRGKLSKIGLQSRTRFWEREGIYGGISWTMQDITQIWYPAHGIHRQKGIVLGLYNFNDAVGEKLGRLTHEQRMELALSQGEKVHPDYRSQIESGVSVVWHRMNHMLGCSARWSEGLRKQWYSRLQAPVGNHYLVGDQMSYHPGWQEGAIHSAFHALADIDQRVRESQAQVSA